MEISKAHSFMVSALNSRSTRQKLIAGNIANIDTPFYQSRDVAFEKALTKEASKIFDGGNNQELGLAKTSGQHIGTSSDEAEKSTIFFRGGHGTRNDGNSVDLDVETTEMSKNSIMYKALVAGLKKEGNIFRSVISASEKTN